MVEKISWNKRADQKFGDMLTYLQVNASRTAAENFFNAVYSKINRLTEHPETGRLVRNSKAVRFVNVDKHRQMFYRVHGRTFYVCNFFDSRQDPTKRPY